MSIQEKRLLDGLQLTNPKFVALVGFLAAQAPKRQDARALFEPFLPCDDVQLRKIYLRLALKYHPDKLPKVAFPGMKLFWDVVLFLHGAKHLLAFGKVFELEQQHMKPFEQFWNP